MSFVRIHAMAESITCSSGSGAESGFDVINATDAPLRIGIEVTGQAKQWVMLDRTQLELLLPPRGQQRIKANLNLPDSVSWSKASFALRVFRIEDPASTVTSPAVAVEVAIRSEPRPIPTALPPEPKRTPWLLILGASAGALALVATIVAVVMLTRS